MVEIGPTVIKMYRDDHFLRTDELVVEVNGREVHRDKFRIWRERNVKVEALEADGIASYEVRVQGNIPDVVWRNGKIVWSK